MLKPPIFSNLTKYMYREYTILQTMLYYICKERERSHQSENVKNVSIKLKIVSTHSYNKEQIAIPTLIISIIIY